MRSNDSVNWPVHSLMLFFHDLSGLPLRCLPSAEPCSMIFGSISWSNHDNLRHLTAESHEARLGYWPTAKCIRSFYALCMICQTSFVAFVFKGLDLPFQMSRQRPALTSIWKHWQDKWPIEHNLFGNTDAFVFHIIASLVMAECACKYRLGSLSNSALEAVALSSRKNGI